MSTEQSNNTSTNSSGSKMTSNSQGEFENALVQYIAIRSDLKWPKGALIAQGAHSSVAAIHLHYADADTARYLADLDRMHKIVVDVPGEVELRSLNDALDAAHVKFKLWVEQPENVPVSLATKPYPKSQVEGFFRAFKLFK